MSARQFSSVFVFGVGAVLVFGYILSTYLGVDRSAVNFVLAIASLVLVVVFLLVLRFLSVADISVFSKLFLIVFALLLVNSVIQSLLRFPILSMLPTLNRVLIVFLIALIGYSFGKRFGKISVVFCDNIAVFLISVFGASVLLQIATGTLVFKNSAYRVSGIYGEYVTGLALYASILAIYFWYRWAIKRNCLFLVCFFCGYFIVVGTESRLSIVSVLVSIIVSNFYVSNNLKEHMRYLMAGLFALVCGVMFIFLTDYGVRLKMSVAQGLGDNSVLTRLRAWEAAISSMSQLEVYTGVGLGGFNLHHYKASGVIGMAAHNDYVQVYVECGVIALVAYTIFQLYVLFAFKSIAKRNEQEIYYARLGFALFINSFVFASLHNPYYYIESLFFATLVIALCFGLLKRNETMLRGSYVVLKK